MRCPICDGATKIIDSRKEPDCVNRRRECTACKYRFSTIEIDNDLYNKTIRIVRKGERDGKAGEQSYEWQKAR